MSPCPRHFNPLFHAHKPDEMLFVHHLNGEVAGIFDLPRNVCHNFNLQEAQILCSNHRNSLDRLDLGPDIFR